jgi:hypothetical protein
MERIKQSLSKEYMGVRIYLSDLREIERTLQGAKSIEITMGNLRFDSINDLATNFKSRYIRELKISTFQPYVSVEFTRLSVRLFVSSDERDEAGIFYAIDRVLIARHRKPAFMYSFYTMWVGNFVSPIISWLFPEMWISAAVAILWSLWLAWLLYIRLRKSSDIRVYERHEKLGFFERTKDQLALAAISSISSLLIGLIVGTLGGSYLRDLIQKIWPW